MINIRINNSRYINLIKNMFLFTISTFIPRAISFFLVPLYTNCLTTTEYGEVDVIMTTVSLLLPILTLDISDAVMRFTIENKEDKKPYFVSIRIYLMGVVALSFSVLVLKALGILSVDKRYLLFLIAMYAMGALNSINIAYLRAIEQVKLMTVLSVVNTMIVISSNLLFLLVFQWGVNGYLLASILGNTIVNIYIFLFVKGWKVIGYKLELTLVSEMLKFSWPLVFAGISWWINSSADRYFISAICGMAATGIYSIAYKIPTILQMLENVFSQAWLLSLYSEYNKPNGQKFVSDTLKIYNSALVVSCGFLIIIDIPLAKFLYSKEFFEAWRYVPLLLISIVFIALSGFYGQLLTALKKTKISSGTTICGAAVNIILNAIFIPIMGIMGAAIATVLGYVTIWLLRVIIIQKYYKVEADYIKNMFMYVLIFLEAVVIICTQNYCICTIVYLLLLVVNAKDIIEIVKKVLKK